jgi:hypothetical protein
MLEKSCVMELPSVHITMATQPQREKFARVAVESLFRQTLKADTLHIELNGFTEPPMWVHDFPITYRLWAENMGSAIRFRRLDEVEGIYLTVDDDLVYPLKYIQHITEALRLHGGIVGFHGTNFTRRPIFNYMLDVECWSFAQKCLSDISVHELGAGCMAMHTDIGLEFSEFSEKNMSDCIIARWAARNGIILTCLARPSGYILEQPGSQNTGNEIWRKARHNNKRQTEIINEALESLKTTTTVTYEHGIETDVSAGMKYIALCIMCKDDEEAIIENIWYHTLIGVDHIIVYDNMSEFPLSRALADIPNVTVHLWKDCEIGSQLRCFGSCLDSYKNFFKWIGFIDVDEFIVIKDGSTDIKKFLKRYEKYGGLGINWKCFGSSGHLKSQSSIVESYEYAAHISDDKHIKSIVNTRHVFSTSGNPHAFKYNDGYFCVNENEEAIVGPHENALSSSVSHNKIQLNHYVTRSREDFKAKVKRGGENFRNGSVLDESYWNRFQGGTKDTSIRDFIKRLIKHHSSK